MDLNGRQPTMITAVETNELDIYPHSCAPTGRCKDTKIRDISCYLLREYVHKHVHETD
jgi:hypothetical protein